MLSMNITSCSAPVCCAGLHTSMSSPQQLFVFLRVRAQSLERLTPSRRLGENSHQIETLRTGLRWNVWGQITHHILDPRNCSPWYYRSIAGCKTSNIKRRQLQLNDFFMGVVIQKTQIKWFKCDHEINLPCGCGKRLVNLQIVCWNLKLTKQT